MHTNTNAPEDGLFETLTAAHAYTMDSMHVNTLSVLPVSPEREGMMLARAPDCVLLYSTENVTLVA
jgi:hypothetical protein